MTEHVETTDPPAPAPADVVLVDARDRQVGLSPKLAAHEPPGSLHRAISAFVFNPHGELLLQRRALGKYHFAGLWSNTCCTHPRSDETVVEAGQRRLLEELGMTCELTAVGTFRYRAVDPRSGLVEDELDHVLTGTTDAVPDPNPEEVCETSYRSLDALRRSLATEPDRYTPWLEAALAVLTREPTWRSA